MESLEEINILDNNFNGTLPVELSQLQLLQELLASNNQLTGTIPSEYGIFLHDLIVLYLDNNLLSGNIPDSLSNLSNIEELLLNGNPNLIGNLNPLFCDVDEGVTTTTGGGGGGDSNSSTTTLLQLVADCSDTLLCDCCTTCT